MLTRKSNETICICDHFCFLFAAKPFSSCLIVACKDLHIRKFLKQGEQFGLALRSANANHIYVKMNEVSRTIPMALMVITGKFSNPQLTSGRPYQVYSRQFRKAIMYGTQENSSVLLFFITLLNVNLWMKKKLLSNVIKTSLLYATVNKMHGN